MSAASKKLVGVNKVQTDDYAFKWVKINTNRNNNDSYKILKK